MDRFALRRFVTVLCVTGLIGTSSSVIASGFQLWEQDGASLANYHAGYAAEAADASIAWYNPAGITRFKNQQLAVGTAAILSDFKYKGSVGITENSFTLTGFRPVTVTFDSVTSQGGNFSIVPSLNYVAPINDQFGFGFSIVAPFGLKTSYGKSTPMRYAATFTSITVVDISPSIGFKISDKASLGIGFDIQKASADFNSVGGLINPFLPKIVLVADDTEAENRANSTGYGFHAGWMYEFNPCARVGISYHSQVVQHFTGNSRFTGPLTNLFNQGQPIFSGRATTNVKLPPYTALSIFDQFDPHWAVMGSFIYTQWDTFQELTINRVAGLIDAPPPLLIAPSNKIQVSIPEHYRNTYNITVGANYYPTPNTALRTGIGYDQSPVRDAFRNVQLPDGDRYAAGLGAHFQATKVLGLDIAWAHIFIKGTRVQPPHQVNGAETVSTSGHVTAGADVFSGQVVWDIC